MTVCWMSPNSSSRAGVAGDDMLRGREQRKGTGKGGKMIGSGLAMLSPRGAKAQEADKTWVLEFRTGAWAGE